MNGNGQLSLKELTRTLNTEKYDLRRVPVFVLMPDDSIHPITSVTLVGSENDRAVYLIAGKEGQGEENELQRI